MRIRYDIGWSATAVFTAAAFAGVALCAAPFSAFAAPGQTVTVGQGPSATPGGRGVVVTFAPESSSKLQQVLPGVQAPPATLAGAVGGKLGGDCLGCSTIGGGSGGGGSGGVVITAPTPAVQPPPQPTTCKSGEQLIVLGGVPRCV
jgi:hypothetical protein